MLDVHVGQMDVPTGSPGDVPRRSLPPSPMSPGGGELVSSLLVPLMGKSSRRSDLTEMGHSPGMVRTTAMNFPRMDATPGDRCAIDLDMMLVTEFPWTDATPGEKYVFGLDSRTVPNSPRLDATPGDRYVIGREAMTVPIFPRTNATPGEMCTMDVGFRPDVNIPRTSSNPGEKSAGELGCRSVLGFSQVDSAQSKCGAVELDFRQANCPPGEIGAEECDYIMPALLAESSDLECLTYQGKDCIRDFSAGGTLSPSVSDLSGKRGPYVTDGPVGHSGTLSSSTSMTEILEDPGGTSPSSDLAGMRGPAPSAESAVRRGPVGPAVSSETLTPSVDVPELCRIVLTVGLCPEVAVPLPAVWDPVCVTFLKILLQSMIRLACRSTIVNTEYGLDRIMMMNTDDELPPPPPLNNFVDISS